MQPPAAMPARMPPLPRRSSTGDARADTATVAPAPSMPGLPSGVERPAVRARCLLTQSGNKLSDKPGSREVLARAFAVCRRQVRPQGLSAKAMLRASVVLMLVTASASFAVAVGLNKLPAWPLMNISEYGGTLPAVYVFRCAHLARTMSSSSDSLLGATRSLIAPVARARRAGTGVAGAGVLFVGLMLMNEWCAAARLPCD